MNKTSKAALQKENESKQKEIDQLKAKLFESNNLLRVSRKYFLKGAKCEMSSTVAEKLAETINEHLTKS